MDFKRNYLIKGKINCKTGIHIGGIAESIKIGGTDSPVVIDRISGLPYIPGSSIKGKMRSLLEQRNMDKWGGKNGGVHNCDKEDCDLCVTFGRGAKDGFLSGPTRLIVRDSFPDVATKDLWESKEDIMHGTEVKGENFLNRISSAATPRFIERVPAGSKFDFEMIFSEYEEKDKERLKIIFEAMDMLEDNYLGASGSRGYGKISFEDVELLEKTKDSYIEGRDWTTVKSAEGKSRVREIRQAL
ncbi:CRISPR-associated protein Csm3 [Methanomicrobium sp. W14]|uniref:type III-A CRISPR-associated RAMP protein Csm3 n=1 Tax=Methanomicrobium sp. W14 TaxID=2817839 RepID=UPI001AE28F67|nr:type III-A CRISPR-associated RAMP protein Csm3 [Methanomicrobium sp. W14]MBP2132415.1 CRISPR-associated protein Csm3 [Methanomicrobium sp. W14]